MKSIFEYDNYRQYLQDFYSEAKRENRKFSFRYFSRLGGFASSSVLKNVMSGARNLGLESIERFAKALKLNREESYFFKNLVHMNQAGSSEERQRYAELLIRCRMYKKTHPLSGTQFEYYSSWYYIAVRELVGLRGFREDPDWIAERTSPPITAAEARKALDALLELGLVARDEDGQLRQSSNNVSTGDEVLGNAVAKYHREMLRMADEAIDRHSGEKRDISSVSVGVSEESAKKIKEMIQKFRKELLEVASQSREPDRVYQLNFQFFPLSQPTDEARR